MTAYVIADDCVPQDLYLCVRDQCSRTVASVKAKLHLMLRPYYILTGPPSKKEGDRRRRRSKGKEGEKRGGGCVLAVGEDGRRW